MALTPKQWRIDIFRSIATISSGLVDPKSFPYSQMKHIGPDNIERDSGRIMNVQTAEELGLISGKFVFDSDSIIYSKVRPNLNKVCMPSFTGLCSADCYSIKPTPAVTKEYLFYLMTSKAFLRQAIAYSMRTGMPKINQDDLNAISLIFPNDLAEQRKIAAILSTQDKVIDLYDRKIEQLQRFKKGVMSKLFPKPGRSTPEVRFPGFEGEWERRKLGDIFNEYSEKGHEELPALTIVQGAGTIRRDESERSLHYDRDSLASYKMVNIDDFIVHLRSFEGGLEKATMNGIISPAYHTFHGENIDSRFYYAYFRSSKFIEIDLKPHVYGIRDGRSIDIDGMKSIKIPWTNLNEQRAVGDYIDKMDTYISLHQRRRDEEIRKKKP